MNISLAAERVLFLPFFAVTNSFLTSIVVSLSLILFAFWFGRTLRGIPSRLQNLVEIIVETFLGLLESISGSEKARKYFPFCFTLLIWILFNNWAGLFPGVGSIGFWEENGQILRPLFRGGTADLNMTLALAFISVLTIQYYGFATQKLGYLKKFFDFSSPVNFFVGILELISELAKIVSFSFRLFGNIFAGEVLLAVIAFLIPILAPAPFYGLEVFVGVIQAFVFAILTFVFINVATASHGEEVENGH